MRSDQARADTFPVDGIEEDRGGTVLKRSGDVTMLLGRTELRIIRIEPVATTRNNRFDILLNVPKYGVVAGLKEEGERACPVSVRDRRDRFTATDKRHDQQSATAGNRKA
jgi:hypothetical protein